MHIRQGHTIRIPVLETLEKKTPLALVKIKKQQPLMQYSPSVQSYLPQKVCSFSKWYSSSSSGMYDVLYH